MYPDTHHQCIAVPFIRQVDADTESELNVRTNCNESGVKQKHNSKEEECQAQRNQTHADLLVFCQHFAPFSPSQLRNFFPHSLLADTIIKILVSYAKCACHRDGHERESEQKRQTRNDIS